MASIINEVVSFYGDEVMQLEDNLEDLEDQLLDIKQIHSDLITEIQEKRREMIHLRKLLFPFKEQLSKLLRVDPGLIQKQEVPYFKDIYDQLLYILQNLESCREILSSLVDLYLNNNDVKMNVVMKQLTLVATIFIPLTFLVGVWGMNFKFMPELDWRYGYLFAWVLMVGIGAFVWWYLKKKEWI
jgi:magnesium transporter